MDVKPLTLEDIERNIDNRKDIEESLGALRAIARRVDELMDRVLALYNFPDPAEKEDEDDSFKWPRTAIMPRVCSKRCK